MAPTDGGRPVKHSLTLSGHRTSVTLEAPFWAALRAMAAAEDASLNALAGRIDAARAPRIALASALRVAVLEWALARAQPTTASPGKVSSSQKAITSN